MSARQLRAFAHATMNLDLDEMIEAGVIDATCTQDNPAWTKWNTDAPMFIVKLSEKQLEALATLIATKWDNVFFAPEINPIAPQTEPANFDWETMTVTPDNTKEEHHVTAPDDIDQSAPGFSRGLSGRVA